MTMRERWLLPEGIEEALPAQAERIESLRRGLVDVFHTWGYELVMPPMVDFIESLLTGTGNDLDLQTFKVVDQLTGRMMGVRADMTPQVARIDAHHRTRDVPVRLCYLGTVLRTRPARFSGTRSPFQVGAELYGSSSIAADVEVLELMLATVKATGVAEVHLDLGHVGIYRGLVRQAGLAPEQEAVLFEALRRNARPEVEAYLNELAIAPELAQMLVRLMDLSGGEEVLSEAAEVLRPASQEVHHGLTALQEIAQQLRERLPEVPLYFDLSELRGYQYHTGVVFTAYTSGHGQGIAWGGRYDDIGGAFGRARPATGFSLDLRLLLSLNPQPPARVSGILAPGATHPALRQRIDDLRAQGERVIVALPDQTADAAGMGCDRVLEQRGEEWVVSPVKAQ